jgi:hypothetical protein
MTHKILHQEITDIHGADLDVWRIRADEYLRAMAIAVKKLTGTGNI